MSRAGLTLAELAELVGAELDGDPGVVVTGAAELESAGPADLSFIGMDRYARFLADTKAGAVIARPGSFDPADKGSTNMLLVDNPHLAFARALAEICPEARPEPGIDPRASVDPGADVDPGAYVGPFAIVGRGARIDPGAVVHGGVFVGDEAVIGASAVLYPGVVVRERCTIGRRVIIHCNAVVGSDGFGYAHDGRGFVKVPQIGTVRIEDDVEIGACTTIDRAALGETVIGRGTKIDNLVQIAHNVVVGEGSAMAAQVGVAGSAVIGRGVQLGGQAGVAGHVTIGDGLVAAARTGLHGNTPGGQTVSGFPSMPIKDWRKAQVMAARLPEMRDRIRELERRLAELEGKGKKG